MVVSLRLNMIPMKGKFTRPAIPEQWSFQKTLWQKFIQDNALTEQELVTLSRGWYNFIRWTNNLWRLKEQGYVLPVEDAVESNGVNRVEGTVKPYDLNTLVQELHQFFENEIKSQDKGKHSQINLK